MKKLFVLMFCMSVAGAAFAQKPLNFSASQSVSYDDNIYLVNDDVRSDPSNPASKMNEKTSSAISTTSVGFDYAANIPNTALAVAVNGKAAYNAYSEDASKNNYIDGRASVGIGNRIFKLNNDFVYTEDPANSELTKRAKRISNGASFEVKTSAENPLGIGFTVSDYLDKYLDDTYTVNGIDYNNKNLSRNRVNGGVQLYYNMSSKTNVYAEYVFSATSYDESDVNDSKSSTVAAGINGQIASKVTGSAKATYEMRKYDNDKIIGAETADDDASVAGYNVSVTWKPSEQNAITLAGERRMEETQFGLNRYYVTTGVSVTLKQKIMDKITATLTAAYENMAYPEDNPTAWAATSYGGESRTDNLLRIRPSLDYKFQQWLSAGVWYQFRDRSSDQDTFEYANNQAGAYVKVMF